MRIRQGAVAVMAALAFALVATGCEEDTSFLFDADNLTEMQVDLAIQGTPVGTIELELTEWPSNCSVPDPAQTEQVDGGAENLVVFGVDCT